MNWGHRKNKERRKVILINPSFQLKFIGYMAIGGLFSLIAFYIADIFFFNRLIQHGVDFNLPADHIYFQLISQQQGLMQNIFWVTRLIIFLFFSLSGLFLSHRIAGPLFNLKNHLKRLADDTINGKVKKELHFRHNDFFQEIPEAFNYYLSKKEELDEIKNNNKKAS